MMPASIPSGLTVGFVYSTALTSSVIEYSESGVGPSHATTLVAPGWVIDARFSGGVAMRPVSYLSGSTVQWYRLPGTETAVDRAIAFLHGQCGQPYDWQDIVAFAVPNAFKRLTGAKHPWMCSYLALAAQLKGQLLPKPPVGAERINPFELLLMDVAAGALALSGPVF